MYRTYFSFAKSAKIFKWIDGRLEKLYIERIQQRPLNLENRLEDAGGECRGSFDPLYLGYMSLEYLGTNLISWGSTSNGHMPLYLSYNTDEGIGHDGPSPPYTATAHQQQR
jgi:hypothetical protein